MGYVIGTDEAGYGPSLGPLVISATVWHVPDDTLDVDLYKRLRKIVTARLPRAGGKSGGRVVMADSKVLYSTATGIGMLERSFLAALGWLDIRPAGWQEIWSHLCPEALEVFPAAPWYLGYDATLPLEAAWGEIDRGAQKLRAGGEAAGARLVKIRSVAVFPDRWNDALDEHGNKATALSCLTLELLCRILAELPDGRVSVICDKHGGRNCYGSLLQRHVGDVLVEIYREEAELSLYRWGPAERRVEACFRPRAERFLPTALASMTSKYLRELAMRPFNQFWQQHVPDLRATAGYTKDARRFKEAIGERQLALGIADRILWRAR